MFYSGSLSIPLDHIVEEALLCSTIIDLEGLTNSRQHLILDMALIRVGSQSLGRITKITWVILIVVL